MFPCRVIVSSERTLSCFRSNLGLDPEDPYHLELWLVKRVYIIDLSKLLHDVFGAELGMFGGQFAGRQIGCSGQVGGHYLTRA